MTLLVSEIFEYHNALHIASLLLAASDLLGWLGNVDSATRLSDGWRRTLEFGMHTDEFSLQNPCARELAPADFAAAVVERLGERPRTGAHRDDVTLGRRSPPTLTLVE